MDLKSQLGAIQDQVVIFDGQGFAVRSCSASSAIREHDPEASRIPPTHIPWLRNSSKGIGIRPNLDLSCLNGGGCNACTAFNNLLFNIGALSGGKVFSVL